MQDDKVKKLRAEQLKKDRAIQVTCRFARKQYYESDSVLVQRDSINYLTKHCYNVRTL